MRVLAVYYTDPVEGRLKFEIASPTQVEEEHYLWVAEHIGAVPDGHAVGLFRARLVYPSRGPREQDWFLDRCRVGTIRIEHIEDPTPSQTHGANR